MNLMNVTDEHTRDILNDFRNVVLSLINTNESDFCPTRFVGRRKSGMHVVWMYPVVHYGEILFHRFIQIIKEHENCSDSDAFNISKFISKSYLGSFKEYTFFDDTQAKTIPFDIYTDKDSTGFLLCWDSKTVDDMIGNFYNTNYNIEDIKDFHIYEFESSTYQELTNYFRNYILENESKLNITRCYGGDDYFPPTENVWRYTIYYKDLEEVRYDGINILDHVYCDVRKKCKQSGISIPSQDAWIPEVMNEIVPRLTLFSSDEILSNDTFGPWKYWKENPIISIYPIF